MIDFLNVKAVNIFCTIETQFQIPELSYCQLKLSYFHLSMVPVAVYRKKCKERQLYCTPTTYMFVFWRTKSLIETLSLSSLLYKLFEYRDDYVNMLSDPEVSKLCFAQLY